MDLSFYKDGYAWFALSSHENWDALYTDDDTHIENLKNLSVKIGPARTADDSEIFYLSAKQMKSKES